MKKSLTLLIILITVSLIELTLPLKCKLGYKIGPGTMCWQCPIYLTNCTEITNLSVKPQIKGYNTHFVNTTAINIGANDTNIKFWCQNGYYKENNKCQSQCKDGCSSCEIDYNFCENCRNGYTWNPDYTCTPTTIGLQGASLALLAFAMVFFFIGCFYLNRANK